MGEANPFEPAAKLPSSGLEGVGFSVALRAPALLLLLMITACADSGRELDIKCYAAAQRSLSLRPESFDYRNLSDIFRRQLDKADPKARWTERYTEVLKEFDADPQQVPGLTHSCVRRAQSFARQ
ncbi:MAG: hypothetical protein EON58_02415 [Alphaproteobacteria bacterium]|nr:MAG: hypothetical protein EON58_02415 [Alphaproteobacteria bacterium]